MTVEDRYKCVGKSTETIEFCIDEYKVDSDRTKIEKCLEKNQKEVKFDSIIPRLENPISSLEHGLAGKHFFKSGDYRDLLLEI